MQNDILTMSHTCHAICHHSTQPWQCNSQKNTSQSTLHTLHSTPCKLHSYTLHSTLYSWHSTLYMLRSTLHCTPPHSKLYTLQITLHRALLTALATQNSIPHTTDLHQMLRLPRKMTLSKLDGSLARNIDCEVGGFGVIRNELVGKPWFGATECENLIKFEDVSHEMLVLRLQHLSSRFFGFLVVYMGKAAKNLSFHFDGVKQVAMSFFARRCFSSHLTKYI